MKNVFLFIFCFLSLISKAELLTDADIREIYLTYVKPIMTDEYKLRYVPLPVHKNSSQWKWEGKDFPRVIAILEFNRFVEAHTISCKKGLALNSGFDPEWLYISAQCVINTNYDEDQQKYDLKTLDLSDKDFDFVMVNQTLEHLYNPIECLKNIYRHMLPGGILYLNVPVNSIPHSTPFHYYTGYTAVGLGAVVKAAGFKILSIGQWGNLEYLKKMFETNSWPDYRQLQNPGLNDFDCPVIAWIFAVKE